VSALSNTPAVNCAVGTVAECEAPYHNEFSVGGITVRISGNRTSDVSLTPPLEPFCTDINSAAIEVEVEWAPDLLETSGTKLFDSGSVWSLHKEQSDLRFDFRVPAFGNRSYKRLRVDPQFSHALLQLNQQCFDGNRRTVDPLEYPLDELLITHRLTLEKAIELHSCGIVGPDGAGRLFIGHSGAGKSTTARLWTSRRDIKILSDDRIIVRKSPLCDLHPEDDPRQIFMYGTPWHGEACFALPERVPLQRIFVLEHGHGNVITRLNKSQAVAELFARSFVPFYCHDYVENALNFLEQVAGAVPCYRYAFEPDQRSVERILNFRD
jgi:hypothetical protein